MTTDPPGIPKGRKEPPKGNRTSKKSVDTDKGFDSLWLGIAHKLFFVADGT